MAFAQSRLMPSKELPEITLPAAGVVPPIVLPGALIRRRRCCPAPRCRSRWCRSMVARDHVARGAVADDVVARGIARDHVAGAGAPSRRSRCRRRLDHHAVAVARSRRSRWCRCRSRLPSTTFALVPESRDAARRSIELPEITLRPAAMVAADRVAGRAGGDLDAIVAVGQRDRAIDVRADEVAGHHVAGRGRAGDLDRPSARVAGDQVAGAGRRAADGIGVAMR